MLAQTLSFFLTMFIARSYSAEAVALYFEYVTWASAIGGFLAMRMDIAAVNALEQAEIRHLIFSALLLSTGITALIGFGLFVAGSAGFTGGWGDERLAYLCILGAACVSMMTTFQNFLVAHNRFSAVPIFQGAVVVVSAAFIGLLAYQHELFSLGNFGLTVFAFLGQAAISIVCILVIWRSFKPSSESLSVKGSLRFALTSYGEHLYFGAPMAVLNSLQSNISTLYLIKVLPTDLVVYFYVLQKVVVSPVSALSSAINSATMRIVSRARTDVAGLRRRFWILLGFLIFVSFSMFIGVYVLSGFIAKLFKLDSDVTFQQLSLVLTGPLLLRFIASTLSGYIPALGRLRYEAYFKLPAFLIAVAVYVFGLGVSAEKDALEVFVVTESVLALFYLLVIVGAIYGVGAKGN